MSDYQTAFTDDDLKGALASRKREAERILHDERKMKQLLSKVKKILEKIKDIPVVSSVMRTCSR